MAFQEYPGLKGVVWVPDDHLIIKKHPCKDCFSCQFCSDERCSHCLKKSSPPVK